MHHTIVTDNFVNLLHIILSMHLRWVQDDQNGKFQATSFNLIRNCQIFITEIHFLFDTIATMIRHYVIRPHEDTPLCDIPDARSFEPMLQRPLLNKNQLQMALLIKLFYDLEWIYHCLLPKAIMQMKQIPSAKFYLSLSAQIKQHN